MLTQLAKKYNVDKCPDIISKYPTHSYISAYETILSPIREGATNVLEIGIGNVPLMSGIIDDYKPGCSLRMWRDYFPNATVYGCDILESVLFSEERICTFQVDQSQEQSLRTMISSIGISDFDFIIDDGSHLPEHQELTFKTLWSFIKPGGIYIIEDVNVNKMKLFADIHKKYNFSDAECIFTHYGSWEGDNFVAFRKARLIEGLNISIF